MTLFTWILATASLIGVVLNIRKHVSCFYIWVVANACWCGVAAYHGIWAQAALFFVYFLLALWGIWSWSTR